jgi:hypothetical protein
MMAPDDKAKEEFERHVLGMLQIFVFAIALLILAMVSYA